ncbi:SUMF1/EgtB/PvdO family nonheme iron enzyme [Desulfovibrio sp. OttesenSCG-928-I05]|nr:SUMF1/EgtB/PvdO family nonheme iron enzyme [Desulfovibrio sp. OttesenSCG-928-I05]
MKHRNSQGFWKLACLVLTLACLWLLFQSGLLPKTAETEKASVVPAPQQEVEEWLTINPANDKKEVVNSATPKSSPEAEQPSATSNTWTLTGSLFSDDSKTAAPKAAEPEKTEPKRAEPAKTEPAKTEVRISGPTHTNSIGMEFIRIPAGSFIMGFKNSFWHNDRVEHKVVISKSFYLGKYEVTQTQWETVMDENPSYYKCQNCPVDTVSWYDAQEFITRLNTKEGHSRYRLPTEAEWEYAAKAGTHGLFFFGKDEEELSGYAWCYRNSENPRPVGGKFPNPWGLYDMYGNVAEWVQDFHSPTYYADSPRYDPEGPSGGTDRVFRGGAVGGGPIMCNSTARGSVRESWSDRTIGFRLAISAE